MVKYPIVLLKIAVLLFIASTAFFLFLHPSTFYRLDDLNILQYNLYRVNYSFIMSIFAYEIPGILLLLFFVESFKNMSYKLSLLNCLLLISSLILIQLGSLPGSTEKDDANKMLYLLLLTWLFLLLHAVFIFVIAYKIRNLSIKHFVINLSVGIYIIYALPYQLAIIGDTDKKVSIAITMCFLWYLSLPNLLDKVLIINRLQKPPIVI